MKGTIMDNEVIMFKHGRGSVGPASKADENALANYGVRRLFASEDDARKACERIGVTFGMVGGEREPTPEKLASHPDHYPPETAKAPKRKKQTTIRLVKPKHDTREAWLLAAIDAMRDDFATAGSPLKDKIRVSCGWMLGTRKAIGQQFYCSSSADGTREIFISPVLCDKKAATKSGVLATLRHELVHAALPAGTKHLRPFQVLAGAVGLVKPWKATSASDDLLPKLEAMAKKLGAYPHAAMSANDKDRKKQTTRLIKCHCKTCGYTVRTTAKWLEHGAPRCTVQSHGEMKVD